MGNKHAEYFDKYAQQWVEFHNFSSTKLHHVFFRHHYANKSIQYIAIFHGCKNGNFQTKNSDVFFLFLLKR